MPTFLLTWNPAIWDGVITDPFDWSCGNTKRIKAGNRLFLIRQGAEPGGIVASGRSLTDVFEDDTGVRRVRMSVDTLLDAENEEIFTRERLVGINAGLDKPMNWGVQISGTQIPDVAAERLEVAWREFLIGRIPRADNVSQALAYYEGAVRQTTVNVHERNLEARRRCIDHYGLSCEVCRMSFGAVYGSLAEKIIHVHHLRPLSQIAEEYVVDPIADLRPVCPNCHAVIHEGNQSRTIAEVQQLLEHQRQT